MGKDIDSTLNKDENVSDKSWGKDNLGKDIDSTLKKDEKVSDKSWG